MCDEYDPHEQIRNQQEEINVLIDRLVAAEAVAKRSIEHKYLTNELVPVELLRVIEAKLAAAEAAVIEQGNTNIILNKQLSVSEFRNEQDAKLIAEFAYHVKRARKERDKEKQDRIAAEAHQYSVGAKHLRDYAERVKERDEALRQLAAAEARIEQLLATNAMLARYQDIANAQLATARGLLREAVKILDADYGCEYVEEELIQTRWRERARAAGGDDAHD